MKIGHLYKDLKQFRADWIYRYNSTAYVRKCNAMDSQIRYYNFWGGLGFESFWFTRFLNARTSIKSSKKQVAICSTFGDRSALKNAKGDIRLFFTGENVRNRHLQYSDNMLADQTIDLSMGFDYFEDARYIRFPLWLTYILEPEATDEQICDIIERIRHPEIGNRSRFCTMVASHDFYGVRETITNSISRIGEISCPGKFMHNDDTLKTQFGDNKDKYLTQFMFNICPENTNAYGYVTEKLFECLKAGCVPIYWGSYNNPEPTVINKYAVLFFNTQEDNTEILTTIEDLYNHPARLKEFLMQDRLLPTAEEEILTMIHQLSNKFETLI